MFSKTIPYKETGYFSDFICDYLEEKEALKPFYHRFPSIKNFEKQIQEKQAAFSNESRSVLNAALVKQYEFTAHSDATKINIENLKQANTFTITTGHQLNLFTGPLYFLYKIIATINLSEELKQAYPNFNFVPIYWMATEDHDFQEINYFSHKGKKITWNKPEALDNDFGAVGVFETESLQQTFELLEIELGVGKNADYLKKLFKNAYLKHENLADATRYLANALFGKYGLVIVDGDDALLKRSLISVITKEIESKVSYQCITDTNSNIEALGFKPQVNPRELNFFYLSKNSRSRIVANNDGSYEVVNTTFKWESYAFLQKEIKAFPERFSPNVVLRPVYQEIILPNLCYIGGGGELAYWLQLKSTFKAFNVVFPSLLLRNSALLVSEKQQQKLEKLQIPIEKLFLNKNDLVRFKTQELSNLKIDFSEQKEVLKKQFLKLNELATLTDKSFINAVSAQERKQIKGLEKLEKRLLKAEQKKYKDQLERITILQSELFPKGNLQERKANFSTFYSDYGHDLIADLKLALQPLLQMFYVHVFKD